MFLDFLQMKCKVLKFNNSNLSSFIDITRATGVPMFGLWGNSSVPVLSKYKILYSL